jgi:hypothetical protein
MKNKIIKIGLLMFATTLLFNTGCKKYLDQVPNDRITIEQVFQKKGPSEQYLAGVYTYVDDLSNIWEGTPWEGNSDEIDITFTKYPNYNLNLGNISPSNSLFNTWGNNYKGIRSATYFMNHIDGNAEILALSGQQLIDQYKAEARFLRAYYYFLLMRQYGPVVLLGDTEIPVDATASEMQFPRSKYDDCVNYVVSQLDIAAAVLPEVPSLNGAASDLQYGRATKGMALAVKARVLLYAASPEFNGNTDFANFKNQDGTALISQTYDVQKWKKAADAAKAVIDLNRYSLYKDPTGDPLKSYQGAFSQGWNSEQIFNRKSNNLAGYDKTSMPRQAGGWNGIAPTQEQVDAYFMKDGKSIYESALYSEVGFTTINGAKTYNMYTNREPRFYASITYNNSLFQGGNMTAPAQISFLFLGASGKNGQPTDFSKTGYLLRKNVNGQEQARPLALFRLAEIYLNYAEALNEYDPGNPDILTYVNLIRTRAGVPIYGSADLAAPSGQVNTRARIWQERRVELAFESHRWFDVRRWKIATQVMGDIHGMDVNKNDDTFFKRVVVGNRLYRNPASNFFPISQYEMDRTKLVVQNPGW